MRAPCRGAAAAVKAAALPPACEPRRVAAERPGGVGAHEDLGVLKLGGMRTIYDRHYEVLPGMSKKKFERHIERVRKLVKKL